MKEAIDTGLEALYTRLILRDVGGKIAPGAVMLLAARAALTPPGEAIRGWDKIPVAGWIMLMGVAWLTGLAVQGLGEFTGRIPGIPVRYFPRRLTPDAFHTLVANFDRVATADDKQRFERYTVIKEATGNASLALAFSLVLILSVHSVQLWPLPLSAVLAGLAALGLGKLHHENAERGAAHAEHVIQEAKKQGGNAAPSNNALKLTGGADQGGAPPAA